jgi:hypothetical protein
MQVPNPNGGSAASKLSKIEFNASGNKERQ